MNIESIVVLALAVAAWVGVLLRRSSGSAKRIHVKGDVSGVAVVADQVHGGIHQTQAAAPGPPSAPPSGAKSPRLDRLKLLLGIIATSLTILGTVLAWMGIVD